jgi:hypothetical protein
MIITYPLNDVECLVYKTRSNKIGRGFHQRLILSEGLA